MMKDAPIMIMYDSTGLGSLETIPISRIRRFSKRLNTDYFVIVIIAKDEPSCPTRTILKDKDPELYKAINEEVLVGEYIIAPYPESENLYLTNKTDGSLFTKLVCDFEYSASQPWIYNVRKVDTFPR